jgi:hypothetical protein
VGKLVVGADLRVRPDVLFHLVGQTRIFGPNKVRETLMKAIAVKPGTPNTVHLAELPAPTVDEIPNGRGVLVRV